MNFGFIGAGNMASAIIKGMTIGTKSYDGNCIYVTSKTNVSSNELAKLCGVHVCSCSQEVIQNADVLILAVKPHILSEILPFSKEFILKKNPLVISIAAGKTLEYIEGFLSQTTPITRVMPNINAKVGASTSGFCCNHAVTQKQKEIVISLFSTIGSTIEIEQSHFGIFSVIAGAAPAFAYLYMDSFARAAQKAGMPKKQALEIVSQTVFGSAKMILESEEHPWALIDQVCSPGGTTIEGISSLQKSGFEATLTKAFDAVLEKDKLIAQK